jgi:hypothetical protein
VFTISGRGETGKGVGEGLFFAKNSPKASTVK